MKDITAVSLRVTGRVQGVGFRWQALNQANALGVSGWVRNDADGAVSMVAQGTPEAVEQFVEWASRGPGYAYVADVQRVELAPMGLNGFDVRR